MAVKTISITTEQPVSNLAIQLYGSLDYLMKLILDNPFLNGVTDTVLVGYNISYDDEVVFIANSRLTGEDNTLVVPQVKTVRILENQSIYDIAVQLYGSVEGVFQLIKDNPFISSINNSRLVGMVITYTEQNLALTEYFKSNRINITSGTEFGRNFDNSFDLSFD